MLQLNNGKSGGRGMGQGRNQGMMGGNGRGLRLRDGSCNYSSQDRGMGRGQGMYNGGNNSGGMSSGRGFGGRFFGNGSNSGSRMFSGFSWIRSAIEDLQQQIDRLRNPSGK